MAKSSKKSKPTKASITQEDVDEYVRLRNDENSAKKDRAKLRDLLLPLLQSGIPCPTGGPFLLVYSEPPRDSVSWKDEAAHWESVALLLAKKYLTKVELKAWRLMNKRDHPETPVPTLNVEPNPKWGKKKK